jgi:hypothetical protein
MDDTQIDDRLARTEKRLQWYLLGLEEAKVGYRGIVFSLPGQERAKVAAKAHGTMRSIRNKGARAGPGIDRTLSRLGWYMDGLRDAAPGYRGSVFSIPADRRRELKARIQKVLERLDVPEAAHTALR